MEIKTDIRTADDSMTAIQHSIPSKDFVRSQIRALRKNLSADDKASLDKGVYENTIKLLSELNDNKAIKCIYTYVSYGKEADTIKLIEHFLNRPVNIAAPKVLSDGIMNFYRISSMDDLTSGYMGIPEPNSNCRLYPHDEFNSYETLMLMPGLAFTRYGKRCGYGGGYYDKFLQTEPMHLRIALCYSWQLFEDFETENTDMYVDYIVTEKEIINCTTARADSSEV